MNKLTRWTLIACACALVAACGKSEKEQAQEAPPVMTAKEMVEKNCTQGNPAAQKELVQACNAEKAKFGKDFEGSNCKELREATKQIDALRKQNPAACQVTLRF